MQTPRAVIIGYGYAGRCFHSYLISITPGLILHGIASRDAPTRERIVSERGCRAYESLEQVLEDPDVDLVVLATPNGTHADMAIRALRAGKHVVTDKVMALTLAECDRMIAAARESGKLLSVFQNRRWDGDYLTVRWLLAEGRLGDVRWIEMAWQGFGALGGWRRSQAMGGGKLYGLGSHLIDQLVMLFPQAIESVYCRLHHDLPEMETESQAMVTIGFTGGATGICDTSCLAAISKPRVYACGTGGTFIKHGLDPQEAAMNAGDINAAVEDPRQYGRLHDGKVESIIPTLLGRWRGYYENIVDVLTHGADLAVTPVDVRRSIAVLDAAFRSADSGQVVQVNIPPVDAIRSTD